MAAKGLFLVSLTIVLIIIVFLVIQGYQLKRDVDAVINRAQVAADAEDMIEYVNKLRENMENHRMTQGHTKVIFKMPDNDMALHYRAVVRIKERLEQISSS